MALSRITDITPQTIHQIQNILDEIESVLAPEGEFGLGDPGANGFVDRTSLGVTAARTLTGTANQIAITNGGGGGNPVFSIPSNAQLSIAKITNLTGNGLVKTSGGDGSLSIDTNTYATQAYADSLVVGLLDDRGNYSASGNTFPASGGSGSAGAILKGDLWTISVAGTLGGHPVTVGDVVRALTDTPGQTDANWAISENNFGYVAANAALSNLSAVAINAALVLGTSDAFALGSTTKQWSDLFLAEGGVINWDNGDITLTQSGDALTLAGGTFQTPRIGLGAAADAVALLFLEGARPKFYFSDTTASSGMKSTFASDSGNLVFSANRDPITDAIFDSGKTTADYIIRVESGTCYHTWRASTANNTAPTERMRLTAAGNLGVGTSAPLSKVSINGGLHVGGDSDAGDNNLLVDGTGTFSGNLLLNASTANLYLKDTSTGFQSALTTVVQLQANNRFQSAGYTSQTTGFGLSSADGSGDFRYLFTDELRAKIFTADLESVLAGSQRITKSFSTISQAFTAPAAGGTATLWVADSATFGDAAVFVSGDSVVIRSMTRTVFGPFTITDCVGVVTAYADGTGANAGQQSWTFTRNAGAAGGNMAASTVVAVNQLVQDMGTTGNGYIESTAVDGAAGVNAPYVQVVTWATAPIAANLTVRTRFGNLKGITGTAEYGLIAGTYSATNGQFFRASDQNFDLHGINFSMWDGATEVIKFNRTAPSFALGSPLPSAYGTGTGVWMGKDTLYKFRAGIPGGNGVFWDGAVLTWKAANTTLDASGNLTATSATLSGAITATSGAVGGFSIGADYVRDAANSFGLASTVTGGDDVRFWAGNTFANRATAPFRLTEAGALVATSATITGAITATSGAINGPLTMSGATSSIAIGSTPPTSATVGTGIWQDRNGLVALTANVQQSTFTAAGITAGVGTVALDAGGIQVIADTVYSASRSYRNVASIGGSPLSSFYDVNDAIAHSTILSSWAVSAKDSSLNLYVDAPTGKSAGIRLVTIIDSVELCGMVISDSNGVAFFTGGAGNTRLVIGTSGIVKLAGAATRSTTEGTNRLDIFNGTAPAGTLTNGISIYSSAGECYIMDAAGNATLQSPHDKETGEWIYFSRNTITGKVLRVDMERLMKAVNKKLGTDFVQEYSEKVIESRPCHTP